MSSLPQNPASFQMQHPQAWTKLLNETEKKLSRVLDPTADDLQFQIIDIDYTNSDEPSGLRLPTTLSRVAGGASFRLFGVTASGDSVCAHVWRFLPYFYVPLPSGVTLPPTDFARQLGAALCKDAQDQTAVVRTDIENSRSCWCYVDDKQQPFIKITVKNPSHVVPMRRVLESGLTVAGTSHQFQTFESNVAFVLRFLVDTGTKGASWIRIPAGKYRLRTGRNKKSRCMLESDMMADAFEVLHDKLTVAPLRILSFDIECCAEEGHFPRPEEAPVVQIAAVVSQLGDDGKQRPVSSAIFVLRECDPLRGTDVIQCKTEKGLLNRFRTFFVNADPDVVTGYNVVGFDFDFLLNRAIHIGCPAFPFLSRDLRFRSSVKTEERFSNQKGARRVTEVVIKGRILLDLLPYIRGAHKLRSYTLNAVSAHFIGKTKDDVHYSQIPGLAKGTPTEVARLAHYCVKDAALPLQLLEKLKVIYELINLAIVTGTIPMWLLNRGQQIRVTSNLLRATKERGFLVPTRKPVREAKKFKGATVLRPIRGFYRSPVIVLDFKSLYPSIIIANNLCITTFVPLQFLASVTAAVGADNIFEVKVSPTVAHHFVRKSVRAGLFPVMLETILGARAVAKKQKKEAKTAFDAFVYDVIQLVLKICANSYYGFLGATTNPLYLRAIAESVTAIGRDMIKISKEATEKEYTKANGYAYDAKVVYGDTDSIMVNLPGTTIPQAMEFGKAAEVMLTKLFPPPNEMEFEKLFVPFLLCNKKRYAGPKFTKNPNKHDELTVMGLETVRRNTLPYVKDLMGLVFQELLINQDVKAAVASVHSAIAKLKAGKVDIHKLIVSVSLGKTITYDTPNTRKRQKTRAETNTAPGPRLAHYEVAKRMYARDPASAPRSGDRVYYVRVKHPDGKKARKYECAMEPMHAIQTKAQLDYDAYLTDLIKPIRRVFEALIGEPPFVRRGQQTLGGNLQEELVRDPDVNMGKAQETAYWKPIDDLLFKGPHMNPRRAVGRVITKGFFSKYAVKVLRCLQCHSKLPTKIPSGQQRALCVSCSKCVQCRRLPTSCGTCVQKVQQAYMKEMKRFRKAESRAHQLKVQCMRCQGNRFAELYKCGNRDCSIFYERETAPGVAEACSERVQRFDW